MVFQSEDPDDPENACNDPAPIFKFRPITITGPRGAIQVAGQNMWNVYRQAVYEYTKRNLTNDSDALNAFRGMEDLIRQGSNTKFWFGLPEFDFDHALLWYPCEPLQRRKISGDSRFPSWSWAAWKGHSHYSGRGWYNGLYAGSTCAVSWMRSYKPDEFIAMLQSRGAPAEYMEQAREQMTGVDKVTVTLDYYKIHRFGSLASIHRSIQNPATSPSTPAAITDSTTPNPEPPGRSEAAIRGYSAPPDGWQVQRDTARNQHYYTHAAYPGIHFSRPISLPDEPIPERPDANGTLLFRAHTVPVRFCDMQTTPPVQVPYQDAFLQVGLNDESRSADARPSWRRILYHQGYRAGCLTLHGPLEELDWDDATSPLPSSSTPSSLPASASRYYLAAISRDTRPRTAPPTAGWAKHWSVDPVCIQYNIHGDEWGGGDDNSSSTKTRDKIPPPGDVEADVKGVENDSRGDALWEEDRFPTDGLPYEVYNVLLLRFVGEKGGEGGHEDYGGYGGAVERVGVGKVHWGAFHHARPERRVVELR
ncbi:Uu.00g132700.m01.CDS01 [Anthostomella pinea]|uniref:Uu.00g132700.m01.CDS01 n=1 Tax=Anthostomella pinea TaxID=933095 RepID=A0AAI8YMV8_9PEZI|nr:Uu.00g132700.m01.CDS01 [Anthostomella pinea]